MSAFAVRTPRRVRGRIGEQTCPICLRVWTPTPFDDCMVPDCACFGTLEHAVAEGRAPCEPCGIAHAWTCELIEGWEGREAAGDRVRVFEDGPLGRVEKRSVEIG